MRRPDLVADFEVWLYGDDDDWWQRRPWFVSRQRGFASDKITINYF